MSFFCCSLSSGSDGNCQFIQTDKAKILIDAGFSGKRVELLLKQVKVLASELDAIFITHEHRDHIQAAGVLARRHNIPIYATAGTWAAMTPIIKEVPRELTRIIDSNSTVSIGDVGLFALPTHHDAVDSVAYIVNWKEKKASFITDTGWISPYMIGAMEKSDLFFIEANHDIEALRDGPYPLELKQRIMGNRGHLSNEHTGVCLSRLLKGNGERILLGHLSNENNTHKLALDEVNKNLTEQGFIEGEHYTIEVAERFDVTHGIKWEE
ncbi:MAG: MBL fold metallo-hydrolase [Tissierellia bacterium]|nr:MBL fold metallo-hydrolase [Tissierellia bacterium]